MTGSLQGKTAIITGASRGIGAQIAYELAKRGANVSWNSSNLLFNLLCLFTDMYKVTITYTSDSSTQSVDDLIEKISALSNNGGKAVKVQADLRQVEAPEVIVQATRAAFGDHIDILVNNAAGGITRTLGNISPEDFAYIYDLNVRAVVLMTQAVLPYLRSPGRIINVSSVGARSGMKELSLYCSSKAALEGLTRCFAAELGPQGHTVNAVNPGPVQTDLLNGIPKETVEMQKKSTPLENRLGTTDDIAQIVGFLSEEGSRWVTGQAISASGGHVMY